MGGKWLIPRYKITAWYQSMYKKLKESKVFFNLVESASPQSKLFFDLDCTVEKPLDVPMICKCVRSICERVFLIDEFSILVSRSSTFPNHKMHVLVPEIVCDVSTRRFVYMLAQIKLKQKDQIDAANALDLRVNLLRMRYATKVDPATRLIVENKGHYTDWYNAEHTEEKVEPFYSILAYDNDTHTPKRPDMESVYQRINKGVKIESEHLPETIVQRAGAYLGRSNMSNRTQYTQAGHGEMEEALTWLQQNASVYEQYGLSVVVEGGLHTNFIKLRRTTLGLCPCDPAQQRDHDRLDAYVSVDSNKGRYYMHCWCNEYERVLIYDKNPNEPQPKNEAKTKAKKKRSVGKKLAQQQVMNACITQYGSPR
jgi:hypothetical protein